MEYAVMKWSWKVADVRFASYKRCETYIWRRPRLGQNSKPTT